MDYRILGPLEVADGERIVPIGAGRPRALLVLLLLHPNQAVATDRLIDELWGETPPATAAKILQNTVSQLRRALGEGALVTEARGYALKLARGAVDVDVFERAVAEARAAGAAGDPARASAGFAHALALWRGPALGELASEPFARAEAARLEERRAVVFEERVDADLALGRHEDLVGELEAAIALAPLRERRRAQLMLALYRSGRQAEALGAYRDARRVLVAELGLEPGPDLQRLESAILQQDPALELASTGRRARPSAPGRRKPVVVLLLAAGGLVVAIAAAAAGLSLSLGHSAERGLAAMSGDTVAAVDASKRRIVAQVPLAAPPGLIASGPRAVWIADVAGRRLFELDPRTRRLAGRSISLPVTPAASPSAPGRSGSRMPAVRPYCGWTAATAPSSAFVCGATGTDRRRAVWRSARALSGSRSATRALSSGSTRCGATSAGSSPLRERGGSPSARACCGSAASTSPVDSSRSILARTPRTPPALASVVR
jgi:DNA-binding SARP family transcriptional activator